MDQPTPRRLLYGRRRGRPLRPGRRISIDQTLPRLAFALPASGGFDPRSLFDTPPRSIWLEIGFGAGEHLAALAERHPDIGFVGCEVYENGIAKFLGEVERRHLENVRLFIDDARLLIAVLTASSIGRVFILFPDPWPKERHKKRRIVSPDTLGALARIMTGGAELRLATDDPDYFAAMLEQVTGHPAFEWLARPPADWRERPAGWPPTRYEEKARAAGRAPGFFSARRRGRPGSVTP
ncbi:MAG: tRNA (guanosine(46)-N7)-methyltransferase TrmB [Stellaceae bacterium]